MRKHTLCLPILLLLLLFSCKPTDIPEREQYYYIENKTDTVIDVLLRKGTPSAYDRTFKLIVNEKVESHYQSGLEGVFAADFDSAIVIYKNRRLVDSTIVKPGLLHDESYKLYDVKPGKNIKSYFYVFTIDDDYINSH
ncbi:MAG: hypothetical protein ACK5MK_14975 [Dysgonomonas sp.]